MNIFCKNCSFYNALYRKAVFSFLPVEKGLCTRLEKLTDEKEACQDFAAACVENKKRIVPSLDIAAEDIQELLKIYGDKK